MFRACPLLLFSLIMTMLIAECCKWNCETSRNIAKRRDMTDNRLAVVTITLSLSLNDAQREKANSHGAGANLFWVWSLYPDS